MKAKKLLAVLTGVCMIAGLAACGSSEKSKSEGNAGGTTEAAGTEAGEGTLVLKAGHVLTEDSAYHMALTQWADEVEEKTEGRVRIDVYANSVLGNERDMIEALQMGTLDITLPNSAPLSNFTDAFRVFDLPFLFRDSQEAYAVIDSEIGDNMLASLAEIGIKGLSIWENGFRYIANNKHDVAVPEDMAGMKIRTMENEIHMDSFRSWGADATAMAFGEVYTALQQNTIDGLENPFTPIYQNKLYEVAPYITMTGHFYCPAPLLIAKTTWDKISPEDRQIIQELADKYKDTERQMCRDYDEENKKIMIEEGATVIEDVDKSLWREAAQPVYDTYSAEIGTELLDSIQAVINGR